MFLITTELFEYAFVAIGLLYLISVLVRQDLQDKNEPPREEPVEEEEKPIVRVLDIENMTPGEKLNVMRNRLDEMGKLLFCEQKLNNVRQCLDDAQRLKCTTDNLYLTEENILGDAISWLEAPSDTRGGFDSKYERPRNGQEELYLQIKNLMMAISRVTNPGQMLLPGENSEPTDDDPYSLDEDQNSYGQDDLEKPSMKEVITPENLLDFSRWLRLKVTDWSPVLIRRASDTAKVWFVVFMTVRTAALSPKRLKNTTNTMHTFSTKCVMLDAIVDSNNNETTVIVRLFPSDATPAAPGTGGLFGLFKNVLTSVKTILKH